MKLAALLVALSFAPGPETQRLLTAVRSGAREGIVRVARRLGPARLGALIEHGDAEARRAALVAAPELPEAWALLPAVVARLAEPEGARAAARIAHALTADPLTAESQEIDDDVRRQALAACAAALASAGPAGPRADALACAHDLGDGDAALRAITDPDAELRAAAVALLGADAAGERERAALRAAALDPSADVASRALAALCARDPRGTMAGLAPDARTRLQALAADATIERGLRPSLAACLRVK